MKKIILLLSFCLVLTGCNVEYQLYVEQGNAKEVLNITIPNATKKELEDILAVYEDPNATATGDYIFSLAPSNTGILATNTNKIVKNTSSALFQRCYDDIELTNTKKKFSVQTKGKFKCFDTYQDLKKVSIRINIIGTVTYHNADRVNGNNYYWDITSKNLGRSLILEAKNIEENKEINQEQQKPDEKPKEETENNLQEQLFPIFLAFVVLLVVVLSGMIYLAIKNKKNNKI